MANQSIFEKQIHPVIQGAAMLLAIVLFVGAGLAADAIGLTKEDPIFPWIVSASMMLFFAIGNSILSLSFEDQKTYWLYSIPTYLAIALFGSLFAYFVSGVSFSDAKSIKWIYIVFTFGYALFASIIRSMRRIVGIAQKQDARLRGEE